jgi:hypothetical protein
MKSSVIVRRDFVGKFNNVKTECSYGGKVNVVVGDNIVIVRKECSYGKEFH